MNWLVFSYSLPSEGRSSPRVALWRRLRRLGTVALAGGMQVLPERDECQEALGWLTQEIRQAHGEALVLSVTAFHGLSDEQLIAIFQKARAAEYAELAEEMTAWERAPAWDKRADLLLHWRRQYDPVVRRDYFGCPDGARVAATLARIAQAATTASPGAALARTALEDYRGKRWVTRPHPFVDRLACIWLIRHALDPQATIRYALVAGEGEIAFDMEGAEFSHHGQCCTFEVLLRHLLLRDEALRVMGEMVHEMDLHDDLYHHDEAVGIERILSGWARSGLEDAEMERSGVSLFEGLYRDLLAALPPAHDTEGSP